MQNEMTLTIANTLDQTNKQRIEASRIRPLRLLFNNRILLQQAI